MNATLTLDHGSRISTTERGVFVSLGTGDYFQLIFQDENEAMKLAAGIELWLQSVVHGAREEGS